MCPNLKEIESVRIRFRNKVADSWVRLRRLHFFTILTNVISDLGVRAEPSKLLKSTHTCVHINTSVRTFPY